jgi:hypothetical protein
MHIDWNAFTMLAWLAACVTAAALLLYEATLAFAQHRKRWP